MTLEHSHTTWLELAYAISSADPFAECYARRVVRCNRNCTVRSHWALIGPPKVAEQVGEILDRAAWLLAFAPVSGKLPVQALALENPLDRWLCALLSLGAPVCKQPSRFQDQQTVEIIWELADRSAIACLELELAGEAGKSPSTCATYADAWIGGYGLTEARTVQ